ncbi:MAG: hypothetical protein R6V08_09075 [Desulfuromonadales bacterium]
MQDNNDNQEEHEVGLYERLASRTAELVENGKQTMDEALKKSRDELTAAGDYSREKIEKIGGFVRRDIASMGQNAGKTTDSFRKAVDPKRVAYGAQSAFSRILGSASGFLGEWAEKTEKNLELKTGEVTSFGTLTCKSCSAEIRIKTTGRIPPCPKCHKTVFRRSY